MPGLVSGLAKQCKEGVRRPRSDPRAQETELVKQVQNFCARRMPIPAKSPPGPSSPATSTNERPAVKFKSNQCQARARIYRDGIQAEVQIVAPMKAARAVEAIVTSANTAAGAINAGSLMRSSW